MRRREFITLLGGATVWPVVARAQVSAKRPTIAWLSAATAQLSASFLENFLRGMRELGYVEGRNFDMLYRYTDGYQERLPALTEEVIRLKPDVILAPAVISAVAARKVTSTIPIVSPALADAVHLGLIASEARPGGNVTGIEPYVAGLPAKQIEFAREIVPGASKIGLLTNLMDPKAPAQAMELEASARTAKINTISVDANHPDDLDGGFRLLSDEKVDVVIVLQTSMFLTYSRKIAASALERRLPTVYGYREHVIDGGLISYGVDLRWCYYRGAYFVDRMPRGTAPGDLPIEFPTKMFLSINLKDGKRVGHPGAADPGRPRRRGDRVRRREFITLIGSTAIAWPLAADAQERMRRVGVLMNTTAEEPEAQSYLAAFQQGMQELGWSIGRNLRVDLRWGGGDAELIRRYAAELAALSPDVMLAAGGPIVSALPGGASRTVPSYSRVDPIRSAR